MVFLFSTPSGRSNFRKTLTLDGVKFQASFLWNARASRWFMTLADAEGNRIITGRKLCAEMPWASHETAEGIPAGQLWVIVTEGSDADPGLRDLGGRVRLMYADARATV